jgi:hypothetical protein
MQKYASQLYIHQLGVKIILNHIFALVALIAPQSS